MFLTILGYDGHSLHSNRINFQSAQDILQTSENVREQYFSEIQMIRSRPNHHLSVTRVRVTGVDPGFFLGGGALVSCSTTSTPINHIVYFFCRIPVVLENRRSSQGGCAPPAPSPQIRPCKREVKTCFFFLVFIREKIII